MWTQVEHPSRLARFPSGPLLRGVDELDDPGLRPEPGWRLARARVVFVDVALLQHDFPALRPDALARRDPRLSRLDERRRRRAVRRLIERWVVERCAVVSQGQLDAATVNTPIPTAGPERAAFRPTRYGRALVVAAAPEPPEAKGPAGAALVDVKGAGVAPGVRPSTALHASGLMQLGEALQDALIQWVVDAVFWHAGAALTTVPLYAVLDAGFDVFTCDGRALPAGLQVRRAHRRPRGGDEAPRPASPEAALKVEIEMLLRQYGVTSANIGTRLELTSAPEGLSARYGGRPLAPIPADDAPALRRMVGLPPDWCGRELFDGINVQLARGVALDPPRAQLVDFGHYNLREHFDFGLFNYVQDRPLAWGGGRRAADPQLPQPRPELCVPAGGWHGDIAWRLARRFRSGELSGREVVQRMASFLRAIADRWRAPAPEPTFIHGRPRGELV
jgi:hypothetical protein